MIARAGAGPDPIPHRQLTADKLADAINFCLKPESLERAKGLASKIATDRGSDKGAQSFHQYLEADRLRCTLAPSRVAVWRIKRTQIRLSAFAACTLANANLLDFHDLKLFRAQEYETDEGPLEPISGFGMGVFRTLGSMSMGIADLPSETVKAVQAPFGSSRWQSQASLQTLAKRSESSLVGESSTSSAPLQHPQASQIARKSLARSQTLPNLPKQPSPNSSVGENSNSTTSNGQFNSRDPDTNGKRPCVQENASSDKNHDMLRPTGLRTSRGFGRIVKAGVQSPMELSVGITKGFHNAPKLWGDDTVRPQEKVSDLKSGMKAIGREFGFGFYDGVTGLFTQPWKGAQKEGTSGFFKGVGKGIGGLITKPGAALFGIPSHMMKGVHKEVQKRFGSNVQTYIVTSRTVQGYQQWLQSDDAEKEDVIDRWKMIQKYLKKKDGREEMMQDILEAQRKVKADGREERQDEVPSKITARSADSFTEAHGSAMLASQHSLPSDDTEGGRPQRQEDADQQADEELVHAMASSEAEAQRHAREALEYENQLKQVMAQSLMELEGERTEGPSERLEATVTNGSAAAQQPPPYDPGYLEGTTQEEFQAQKRGEKTTEEKTEEEIVMEYVKKQSLLEAHHRGRGKGHATAAGDDDEEEDLQKALSLSMQGHE
jgi:hypothetical protein